MNESSAAVLELDAVEPNVSSQRQVKDKKDQQPKKQPRYHVVLWDDPNHTYQYVIRMMQELFGHPAERGMQIATLVDKHGRAICLTTTKEHAELKRDQIHAYGSDPLSSSSIKGSMRASIEPDA